GGLGGLVDVDGRAGRRGRVYEAAEIVAAAACQRAAAQVDGAGTDPVSGNGNTELVAMEIVALEQHAQARRAIDFDAYAEIVRVDPVIENLDSPGFTVDGDTPGELL